MIRLARGVIAVAGCAAFAASASADDDHNYRMDFHRTVNDFSDQCTTVDSNTLTCETMVTNGPVAANLDAVYVILTGGVLAGKDGARAVQFGIDYASTGEVKLWNWTVCQSYQQISIDGENGTWPTSGSGLAVAFGDCVVPPGTIGAIPVGYFFTQNPPQSGTQIFTPIPSKFDETISVTDCDKLTYVLDPSDHVGTFDFGLTAGAVACGPKIPTRETSWGQVKAHF